MENTTTFESILKSQNFIVLDGGFSTECECQGANIEDELWSAKLLFENPELVKKVHYDFFQAGADVAITSTYQASVSGFQAKGFSKDEAV